jgi:hypothetical protein
MVAIQVRDVPEGVRDALAAEARRRGQSLQLFLAEVLEREAASARNLAWLRDAARGSRAAAAGGRDMIRETWEERDQAIAASSAPADGSVG